jgi:16S rRNA A1518/A1519 N6-dimethyltransferase RsmA/KsgA/DIM1 with predicted DNA glycosylase/AP lyase activity
MMPKAAALQIESQDFLNFCKTAFAQKRKTLINNLRSRYKVPEVKRALDRLEVSHNVRAEALSLRQLAETYRNLQSYLQ